MAGFSGAKPKRKTLLAKTKAVAQTKKSSDVEEAYYVVCVR
jgi:hypothetical protein